MNTNLKKLERFTKNQDGIIVPVILWWLGVPLVLVLILWLIF